MKSAPPTRTRRETVFISYARENKPAARGLYEILRGLGHNVFMDTEGIHAGDNWESVLQFTLDRTTAFIVCWSRDAAKSNWVKNEYEQALRRTSPAPRIIPVLLDDTPLPPSMSHIHAADLMLAPIEHLRTVAASGDHSVHRSAFTRSRHVYAELREIGLRVGPRELAYILIFLGLRRSVAASMFWSAMIASPVATGTAAAAAASSAVLLVQLLTAARGPDADSSNSTLPIRPTVGPSRWVRATVRPRLILESEESQQSDSEKRAVTPARDQLDADELPTPPSSTIRYYGLGGCLFFPSYYPIESYALDENLRFYCTSTSLMNAKPIPEELINTVISMGSMSIAGQLLAAPRPPILLIPGPPVYPMFGSRDTTIVVLTTGFLTYARIVVRESTFGSLESLFRRLVTAQRGCAHDVRPLRDYLDSQSMTAIEQRGVAEFVLFLLTELRDVSFSLYRSPFAMKAIAMDKLLRSLESSYGILSPLIVTGMPAVDRRIFSRLYYELFQEREAQRGSSRSRSRHPGAAPSSLERLIKLDVTGTNCRARASGMPESGGFAAICASQAILNRHFCEQSCKHWWSDGYLNFVDDVPWSQLGDRCPMYCKSPTTSHCGDEASRQCDDINRAVDFVRGGTVGKWDDDRMRFWICTPDASDESLSCRFIGGASMSAAARTALTVEGIADCLGVEGTAIDGFVRFAVDDTFVDVRSSVTAITMRLHSAPDEQSFRGEENSTDENGGEETLEENIPQVP